MEMEVFWARKGCEEQEIREYILTETVHLLLELYLDVRQYLNLPEVNLSVRYFLLTVAATLHKEK